MVCARLPTQHRQHERHTYRIPRHHEYIHRFVHTFDVFPFFDNQIEMFLGLQGIHKLLEGNPGNDIKADKIVGHHGSHTDS